MDYSRRWKKISLTSLALKRSECSSTILKVELLTFFILFLEFWLFTDPDQLKDGPKKNKNEDSDGDDEGTNHKSKKAPIVEVLTPE